MALLWRTDKVSAPLDSWQDLFRDELNDRLLLPKFENIMAVYLALMFSQMSSGSIDDMDAGFASLSRLAPSAVAFETSSARMAAYLKTGRAWATVYWSGRAQLLKDSGVPVEYTIPREGTIPLIVTASIPAGARNKEHARRFIDFWLEKRSQEAWVQGYSVGSIRTDLDLPPEVRARQITSREDIDRLLLPDFDALARNRTDWNSRWKREVIEASK
jgi:putative spermidine/putrescine transport system substrate-binding protein